VYAQQRRECVLAGARGARLWCPGVQGDPSPLLLCRAALLDRCPHSSTSLRACRNIRKQDAPQLSPEEKQFVTN